MGIIHHLAHSEAQKIAAGQVIERPACVVKELIENSLDAGATKISLYLERGGRDLIRVVDNGSGMDATDASACFGNHATSKISSFEQVATTPTFGFRGEALAALCAISKITLQTVEKGESQGTEIVCCEGAIQTSKIMVGTSGTDIVVRDIFYNVPARRKFLKQEETEWRAILTLFQAFCLSHLNVNFQIFNNNQLIHGVPATSTLKNRIIQVLDERALSHLVVLDTPSTAEEKVEGVISNHQISRYNKNQLFFFVNGRYVKNYQLSTALLKGYQNVLPAGRYPIGVIKITLDPQLVDINVDPRKSEVRFIHPRRIELALSKAVNQALGEANNGIPEFRPPTPSAKISFGQTEQQFNIQPRFPSSATVAATSADKEVAEKWLDAYERKSHGEIAVAAPNIAYPAPKALLQENIPPAQEDLLPLYEFRFLGQFQLTYLLFDTQEGLVIVDQHAAHERILFNQFAHRLNRAETIPLLFPSVIQLTSQQTLEPIEPLLKKQGIELEPMGPTQAIVRSLPVHLKHINVQELVDYLYALLIEHDKENVSSEDIQTKINHALQAQMACKAAVKAGDLLQNNQAEQLMKDLQSTQDNFTCPHGRPTRWTLTVSDLEKKFKRRL